MSYQLIITEKPSAAKKIAEALADEKPKKYIENKVTYYEINHNGKKIFIGCAVGHLFNLAEKEKKAWTYPVFDICWQPSYKIRKSIEYTKKYYKILEKLSQKAIDFVIACDYDQEGSLIGYNILRFISKKKDASRMKFSTLTKDELIKSYENASKHLNFPLIEAGETRHYLDHYYGISISRALTLAIKHSTGNFKILSSGRVQGPALKILSEREKQIQKFKPEPYWELELQSKFNNKIIKSTHKKNPFKKKQEAEVSKKSTKEPAIIKKISRNKFIQFPPNPFDLTSLQLESYKTLRISPKETLNLAQNLYLAGLISYPRTSSNQLPSSLNYKRIISNISKQKTYKKLCDELLKSTLKPNNGKKTDPAHPACYPTGEIPKNLSTKESKLYDLIVKRTLATFAPKAERETITLEIDANKEIYITKGTRTLIPGWHKFYQPYTMLKEEELPNVKENDKLKIRKVTLLNKETQPPKRYTPASIIKELSNRNLGTKGTRAEIIDSLYQRNYVKSKSLEVTSLGLKTVETLDKYSPLILDEKLTRHFEDELELIRQKKKKGEDVLKEARNLLTKILNKFKENELKIGKELSEANIKTRDDENIVGPCPNCNGNLKILYSKKTKSKFIACENYPKCKTIFNIPNNVLIKTTNKLCKECNHPLILVIRKGKRPQELCINLNCSSKQNGEKTSKKCPKCSSKLVLRKSIYGQFYGCSNYPKCKYIEQNKEAISI